MKLFFSFNEDYKEITDIFLSSMNDDFELMPVEKDNFKSKWKLGGGLEGAAMKKEVLDFAFENTKKDEIFVVSDTDIKFYKPSIKIIIQEIKNYDILFQKEHNKVRVNMGFMAMRNNPLIKKFWEDVYKACFEKKTWDQRIANDYLHGGYKLNWSRMSDAFWNWSMGSTGVKFDENTCLHHANCAITKENKIKQFSYVEDCFRNGKEIDCSKRWL